MQGVDHVGEACLHRTLGVGERRNSGLRLSVACFSPLSGIDELGQSLRMECLRRGVGLLEYASGLCVEFCGFGQQLALAVTIAFGALTDLVDFGSRGVADVGHIGADRRDDRGQHRVGVEFGRRLGPEVVDHRLPL